MAEKKRDATLPRVDEIVTSDPEVMGSRQVFRGTRVPIEALFENLADWMSIDDILKEYPTLDRDDIVALLRQIPSTIDVPHAA